MKYEAVTTPEQFQDYCGRLAEAQWVAMDTEFVAEETYWPQLCLVQVATDAGSAIIDPLTVGPIDPFWRQIADRGAVTILHAGRGELEFCLRATGRLPADVFDVQIAAGFVGLEFPASYRNLVERLLGRNLSKAERRTDWRRRPLTGRQLSYALEDVRHLPDLHRALEQHLEKLGRRGWFQEETATWQEQIRQAAQEERWWRVSGNSGLDPQGRAVLRELWRWRDQEAQRRDVPPRRVLRDDLLVELARRKTADLERIKALRGLDWGKLKRLLPEMAGRIRRALELPPQQWPNSTRPDAPPQQTALAQFLFAALANLCRREQIAVGLVGGPNDLREWLAWRTTPERYEQPPLLARGWRAEVVGRLLEDLLSGKKVIRVADAQSETPLVFEDRGGNDPAK